MKTLSLLGTTLGFAFTAGLNLYATVLVIGIVVRFGWVALPAQLSSLSILADPIVLGVAAVMYAIEFLADKLPAVDHAWDVAHTVIRPVGAVWIAWRTIGGAGLSEPAEVALLLAAGGVALSAHAGKAGTRLATASIGGHFFGLGLALSLVEDIVAFVVAPLAIIKPFLVLALVAVGLAGAAVMIPLGARAVRKRLLRQAGGATSLPPAPAPPTGVTPRR